LKNHDLETALSERRSARLVRYHIGSGRRCVIEINGIRKKRRTAAGIAEEVRNEKRLWLSLQLQKSYTTRWQKMRRRLEKNGGTTVEQEF